MQNYLKQSVYATLFCFRLKFNIFQNLLNVSDKITDR